MQSVGRRKYESMPHFFSELLQKYCLATHWEWTWLFCTGERSQNGSAAYVATTGKGARSFVCLCVCTVYVPFCASGFKLCTPGCPAVLAWLHCKCKASARKSTCFCFFTRMKQLHTSQQSAATGPCATATFKAESQHLLAIQMTNTGPVQ